MSVDPSTFNYLAILIAGVSMFLVGGIWYSALFVKPWMRENNFTIENLSKVSPAKKFGLSFILSILSALILAFFIGKQADMSFGLFAGFMVGLWVAFAFGINYLFEMRSLKLFLINASYNVVAFTIMGGIIGALL